MIKQSPTQGLGSRAKVRKIDCSAKPGLGLTFVEEKLVLVTGEEVCRLVKFVFKNWEKNIQ